MTGPDHFKEAERFVELSAREMPGGANEFLLRAQVHATLALAAATLARPWFAAGEEAVWREAMS